MGGITSGVGIFSGIDTQSLIQQLLAIEARPRQFAQQRLFQLQSQQAAYLDINSRLNALKTASSVFRTGKTFQTMKAQSSDETVLTATAGTNAVPGTFQFIVDQLVTNQQLLSRGFADLDSSPVGASSFTFESQDGRLDRDIALADLNGGEGIDRGKITINDGSGPVTVDLSKVATVNEVLDAINGSGADVTASVSGGGFVIEHNAAGTVTIGNADDNETATSLGIVGSGTTVTGSNVYTIAGLTPLAALNDGNGVVIDSAVGPSVFSFTINVGGTGVNVNVGEVYDAEFKLVKGEATTVAGVIERINSSLEATLGDTSVVAAIDADGTGLVLTDSMNRTISIANDADGTAADLGLTGSGTGTLQGERIISDLNSTLVKNLLGGSGVGGDGLLNITARDGTSFSVDVSGATTVQEILDAINTAAGNDFGGSPAVLASLNETGNGLVLTDQTGTGSSFSVTGTSGNDTAEALGLATDASHASTGVVDSGSLQHRYVTGATLLADLNAGKGIGTGTFRITDSTGATTVIDIDETTKTLQDLINEINGSPVAVTARINDNGDGIVIEEKAGTDGGLKIKIADETGAVAKNLELVGEATGTGDDNFIDGSLEVVVEFDPDDTLQDVTNAINKAGAGVAATIINDGTGSTPFHLSLTSKASGVDGRFIVDTGGFDLGLETLSAGSDSKVFFGSDDPAKAVMLTSSSNTLDNVITGVSIDLSSTSDDPVQLTISRNTTAIEEKIGEFVTAFNSLIERIDFQTRYDQETKQRGALLGDGTLLGLRNSVYNALQSEAVGVSGSFTRLVEIGITVGDGGKIEFDSEQFREALEQDPAGVEALFTAYVQETDDGTVTDDDGNELDGIKVVDPNKKDTFSSLGVMGIIEQLATRYSDTVDGVLTLRGQSLDNQISLQQKRIDQFTQRLAARQAILEQQFLTMERAIASFQTQQQALGSIQFVQ